MEGNAELRDGMARKLYKTLKVGALYTTRELANLIGNDPRGMQGGVIPKGDAQLLLVTLLDPKYPDEVINDTLHWYGQENQKYAERHLIEGTRDSFVFIRDKSPKPFVYYGRAAMNRILMKGRGTPSEVILDLFEYSNVLQESENTDQDPAKNLLNSNTPYKAVPRNVSNTEAQKLVTVRTEQGNYRREALKLWDGKCAVTGVDEPGWLIASHIKPWRESNNDERCNPYNSLILTPNYDKLFDRGVISFSPDNGKIILPQIHTHEMWKNLERMHIDDEVHLSHIPNGTEKFLDYHNKRVFGYQVNDGKNDDQFLAELVAKAMA